MLVCLKMCCQRCFTGKETMIIHHQRIRATAVIKTSHMQSGTITPLFFIIFIACNSGQSQAEKSKVASAGALQTTISSTVKIIRNGETIVEYNSRTPNVVVDADVLMIELNSPDTKYSFMGYINGITTGNYPLTAIRDKGKAAINIYNEGIGMPASINPSKGEIIITRMNGKTCSGTFSGSLKHLDGKEFTITGSFTNIPVRAIDAL